MTEYCDFFFFFNACVFRGLVKIIKYEIKFHFVIVLTNSAQHCSNRKLSKKLIFLSNIASYQQSCKALAILSYSELQTSQCFGSALSPTQKA